MKLTILNSNLFLKNVRSYEFFFLTQILFSSNFMDSILMISLNINNQKHN